MRSYCELSWISAAECDYLLLPTGLGSYGPPGKCDPRYTEWSRLMTRIPAETTQRKLDIHALTTADLRSRCIGLLDACRGFAEQYSGLMYAQPPQQVARALREFGKLQSMAMFLDGATAASSAAAIDNPAGRDQRAIVEAALGEFDDLTEFVAGEWLRLPDHDAGLLLGHETLHEHAHYLATVRSAAGYTLPEPAEAAIAAREPAAKTAWVSLYHQVIRALRPVVRGEPHPFETVRSWLESDDGELRSESLSGIYDSLEPISPILALCLDTLVADQLAIDALRGLPHPRVERDLTNELPSQVIDKMLEITRRNYDIAQRWFAHKARLLGLAQLGFEDARAPITLMPLIPYGTAVQAVADTFDAVAGWAGDIVRAMFSQGQVDAEARPGKHPRAFCQSRGPRDLPRVLLTYLGSASDVLSLAHELGHAVHFILAGRQCDGLTFEAPVSINEILPALAELLLCDTMIRYEGDPGLQQVWAAKQLESCFETIFLSTVLTEFEIRAHQMRDAEGVLTDTRIRELWMKCGEAYYGPDVRLPDRWGLHWMLIPHVIHERFYSYAYIFARLIALKLYADLMKDPGAFREKFLVLLSSGGSASPADQLSIVDIDITDPDTWNTAISDLAAMLDRMLRRTGTA